MLYGKYRVYNNRLRRNVHGIFTLNEIKKCLEDECSESKVYDEKYQQKNLMSSLIDGVNYTVLLSLWVTLSLPTFVRFPPNP